jgi:hypothetical protein
VTAGLIAFVGGWFVGVLVVVLAIRQTQDMSYPTEACEGAGDAMFAGMLFYLGVGLSFCVAIVLGLVVFDWIATRDAKPIAVADSAAGRDPSVRGPEQAGR